jgi:hypothetical protein
MAHLRRERMIMFNKANNAKALLVGGLLAVHACPTFAQQSTHSAGIQESNAQNVTKKLPPQRIEELHQQVRQTLEDVCGAALPHAGKNYFIGADAIGGVTPEDQKTWERIALQTFPDSLPSDEFMNQAVRMNDKLIKLTTGEQVFVIEDEDAYTGPLNALPQEPRLCKVRVLKGKNDIGKICFVTTFLTKIDPSLNSNRTAQEKEEVRRYGADLKRVFDNKSSNSAAAASSTGKIAEKGNFAVFETMMKRSGYSKFPATLNGFVSYQKDHDMITMRGVNGNCCEGALILPSRSDASSNDYILGHLVMVYPLLEATLNSSGKDSTDISDASAVAKRTYALLAEVMHNLSQANRTEFAFDHLNVRAECQPVSQKDLKAGNGPVLSIKLWIP